jgi:hypothetical protein
VAWVSDSGQVGHGGGGECLESGRSQDEGE